jgi:triosephosphate isomerase
MEPVLIAANWKMHKNHAETRDYFQKWAIERLPQGRSVAFFPPFTLLPLVRDLLPEGHWLGGQNVHEAHFGAFTGEVSCVHLLEAGCRFVLVGHSERRHLFGEDSARVGAKFRAALDRALRPILCVGETLAERQQGRTFDVVLGQLREALGERAPESGFDVAYEPVWAIGTGHVARPEDASEVHGLIHRFLGQESSGRDARILYGGSVKPDNAADLLAGPWVHGLLVGGASLDPASFAAIVRAGA